MLGVSRAARLACVVMAVPQIAVVALLVIWGHNLVAAIVALLLAGQCWAMVRMLRDPVARAPWYNATGTSMYVIGMLASAFGLGGVWGL